jgi:hypothetical protein
MSRIAGIPSRYVEGFVLPPAYFNAMTDIISHYKSSPAAGETPNAYGQRYGKRFAFRSDSVFCRDLVALYYKAKYSPVEISPDEVALMEDAHREMLMLLRNTRNDWEYVYLRYVRRVGEVQL